MTAKRILVAVAALLLAASVVLLLIDSAQKGLVSAILDKGIFTLICVVFLLAVSKAKE
jgi:hypothetical protein